MAEVKKPAEKKRQSIVPMVNFLFLAIAIAIYLYPAYQLHESMANAELNFNKCRENVDELHKKIEAYRKANNGAVPKVLDDLFRQGKNKPSQGSMPNCPVLEANAQSRTSAYADGGYEFIQVTPFKPAVYTIKCKGAHHDSFAGVRKNEPFYSSSAGLHPTDYELSKRRHLRGE